MVVGHAAGTLLAVCVCLCVLQHDVGTRYAIASDADVERGEPEIGKTLLGAIAGCSSSCSMSIGPVPVGEESERKG
uniref:Putative secreted protein n=1 Tax=Anopheles marajoara TaxID=58244 RepID=A0A2M4CCQ8_9DIPT